MTIHLKFLVLAQFLFAPHFAAAMESEVEWKEQVRNSSLAISVRIFAIQSLAQQSPNRVRSHELLRLLREVQEPEIRLYLVDWIRAMNLKADARLKPFLMGLIYGHLHESEDDASRAAVARLFTDEGFDPEVLRPIIDSLSEDPAVELRFAAAETVLFGRYGTPADKLAYVERRLPVESDRAIQSVLLKVLGTLRSLKQLSYIAVRSSYHRDVRREARQLQWILLGGNDSPQVSPLSAANMKANIQVWWMNQRTRCELWLSRSGG